ncbi:acyl-CoA thioesterase [candidate division KSB1 bacterium]|nr:acyl-CoA thioesterase [candidate division KSB1 bacterium]
MTTKLTSRLHVRSYEIDSFGHVNNAVFLNYLEFARSDYLRQKGMSFSDFHNWRSYPFVVDIHIKYKNPALFGDELEIIGWISKASRTSFTLSHEIYNAATGRLLIQADVTLVFVDENQRPTAIPEIFREKFEIER